jgi:hypothetical protein
MSAGVIPVVLHRGGVTDIVRHGATGFLGSDAAAVAELTKQVFALDAASLAGLRKSAVTHVEKFSPKAFAKNFRVLAHRGVLTKPFRFLIQQTSGGCACGWLAGWATVYWAQAGRWMQWGGSGWGWWFYLPDMRVSSSAMQQRMEHAFTAS